VSVLVIDWTTMGWALPTQTPPISTDLVERREEDGVFKGVPRRFGARVAERRPNPGPPPNLLPWMNLWRQPHSL